MAGLLIESWLTEGVRFIMTPKLCDLVVTGGATEWGKVFPSKQLQK